MTTASEWASYVCNQCGGSYYMETDPIYEECECGGNYGPPEPAPVPCNGQLAALPGPVPRGRKPGSKNKRPALGAQVSFRLPDGDAAEIDALRREGETRSDVARRLVSAALRAGLGLPPEG